MHAPGLRIAGATVLLFVAVGAGLANDDAKPAAATDPVARAREVMGIRAPGSLPFYLTVRLRIMNDAGDVTQGEYALNWAAPDRWKDQLGLPDYRQTRVNETGKLWVLRDPQYSTWAAWNTRTLLKWFAPFTPNWTLENSETNRHETERQGSTSCQVVGSRYTKERLCFDNDHGYLTEASESPINPSTSDEVTELGDYFALGQHFLPKNISVFRGRSLVAEAEVTDASLPTQLDPQVFVIPGGATQETRCEHPQPPRPSRRVEPKYTDRARREKIQGDVVHLVHITDRGVVDNVILMKSLTPDLDQAAAQTIGAKWRFKPAACGNEPIPFEVEIQTTFRLF